jgi:hypothetical protein
MISKKQLDTIYFIKLYYSIGTVLLKEYIYEKLTQMEIHKFTNYRWKGIRIYQLSTSIFEMIFGCSLKPNLEVLNYT